MKRKWLLVFIIVLIGILTVSCKQNGEKTDEAYSYKSHYDSSRDKYIFRFVHEEMDGSIQDVYAKKFAKILEKKSKGKIEVEIYPVGQIGDATQQTELLQNGGIDFAMVSPGNTGTIVPENQLFSLHFLFSENMEVNRKVFSESKALNEMMNKKYLEKDLKVLSYWPEGFMQWTSNKKIGSPSEFKGFKMRTMPSPVIVASYEAYGANPTPMPYMEVYSGLQLKMIDGQENPVSAIEEMKFGEVQKYITLSNSSLFVTTTCVNPKFYDSLPKDIKKMVDETVKEMDIEAFKIQEDLNDGSLEKIVKDTNISVEKLTKENVELFKAESMKAREKYKKMTGKSGEKILDLLEKEITQMEKNK